MSDLLDRLLDPNAGALSDRERKKLADKLHRKVVKPRGHAWAPGTGPEGETCRTCAHYVLKRRGKTYRKCGLMQARWTGGPGTDIRAGDPACLKWEAKPAEEGQPSARVSTLTTDTGASISTAPSAASRAR